MLMYEENERYDADNEDELSQARKCLRGRIPFSQPCAPAIVWLARTKADLRLDSY